MVKPLVATLISSIFLVSCGGSSNPEPSGGSSNPEPTGDNRLHYDWLMAECEINEKLIEENNYTKNAKQLGRRFYCSEAEEMRERITGVMNSSDPGAYDF